MRKPFSALAGLCLLASPLFGQTVTVNDAGDTTGSCATTGTGTCTLRDAMTFANTGSGVTIAFNIPGAGVHTIAPTSALPTIDKDTTINGFSQPGSSANTNGPGLPDNSVHLIEIDFENQSASDFWGLEITSGGSNATIRGLVVNRAPTAGIAIFATDSPAVDGCFVGTDPTGMSSPGRQQYGVLIDQGSDSVVIGGTTPAKRNVLSGNLIAGLAMGYEFGSGGSNHQVQGNFIGPDAAGTGALSPDFGVILAGTTSFVSVGGTTPAERNVISGNASRGVIIGSSLGGQVVENNTVMGNFVGTDVTGLLPLGNGEYGIECNDFNNTIGGPSAGAGNVIAFNALGGIGTEGGCNGLVAQGNFIGTDATGTVPMGNHGPAITIYGTTVATIGGINAGEGNTIAFNGAGGISGAIWVGASTKATIRGNSIHDNLATGIDLSNSGGPDGVTANDLGDGDSGGNNLQNFPIVTSVSFGANTTVDGFLNSTASTTYDLDFYSNPACSSFPREFLQGATYIGSSQVTTDGSGNATIHVTTLASTPSGSRISVTATDPAGNTSEFSQRLPFSVTPKSGDSGGGTALTIAGTNFLDGATVTIGGVAATGVVVNSYDSISATTPALAPGTANDIVVTNSDATTGTGTLVKGFVADFLDVPNSNQFYSYVTTLVSNAITAGIGSGLYGINDATLRQQMAVFILKGKHGLCYTPPTCSGMFTDVPCPSTFANWIEAMANEGITGGCGGSNFCPMNPVRRDQMAVFLLKAEHGSTYVPPTCTGIFPDVPCSSPFAPWIEQLFHESITGGCGGGNYCPSSSNTRGQMAVFITKTFNLQ